MAPLVQGSGHGFAFWKLGLTSLGVILLTLLARMRVLGGIAVGSILYVVLFGYVTLVGLPSILLLLLGLRHYREEVYRLERSLSTGGD